jgi:uncharacterized delta-60 repeat protein
MKGLLVAATLCVFFSQNLFGQALTLRPDIIVKGTPYITTIVDAPQGGYFLATMFDHVNGTLTGNLAKVDNSGQPVAGFKPVFVDEHILSIIPLVDGKILIAGVFKTFNGIAVGPLIRLEADGTLDQTFSFTLSQYENVKSIALQADGKIIVVGNFLKSGHQNVIRLNSNGTVDPNFPSLNLTTAYGYLTNVNVDSQNKIWLGDMKSIFKLEADGSLSSGFPIINTDGNLLYTEAVGDKIYVGGHFSTIGGVSRKNLAVINSNGSIDANVNVSTVEYVNGFAVKNDGKILINDLNNIRLFEANGTESSTLVTGGPEGPNKIIVDQNQNVVISGGAFLSLKGIATPFLGRLNSNFARDNDFQCQPTYAGDIQAIASYPDGRILIGGGYDIIGFNSSNKKIARIKLDGSLDLSFNPDIPVSPVIPNFRIRSIVIQPDEKILVTTD